MIQIVLLIHLQMRGEEAGHGTSYRLIAGAFLVQCGVDVTGMRSGGRIGGLRRPPGGGRMEAGGWEERRSHLAQMTSRWHLHSRGAGKTPRKPPFSRRWVAWEGSPSLLSLPAASLLKPHSPSECYLQLALRPPALVRHRGRAASPAPAGLCRVSFQTRIQAPFPLSTLLHR